MIFNVLIVIIAITSIISMKLMNDAGEKSKWLFSPYLVKHQNEGLRIFKHIWVHADIQHLLFNMLSLYMLGNVLVKELSLEYGFVNGQFHFLKIYFLGALFSTIWPYLKNKDNPSYRSLGASGAVSSVVFATIIMRPDIQMGLLFFPIYIPGYLFGLIYLAYEFWANRKGNTGIAHDAHIGGAVPGIIYMLVITRF